MVQIVPLEGYENDFTLRGKTRGYAGNTNPAGGVAEHAAILPGTVVEASRGFAVGKDGADERDLDLTAMGVSAEIKLRMTGRGLPVDFIGMGQ